MLIEALMRAYRSVSSSLATAYDEAGLNESRFLVLRAVRQLEATGCTQTRLAQELNQSESNICTLIERMRTDGLVYRQRMKDDRRKRLLLLTDLGRQKLSQSEAAYQERSQQVLRQLNENQVRELSNLLHQLVDRNPMAILTKNSNASVPKPHIRIHVQDNDNTKSPVVIPMRGGSHQ